MSPADPSAPNADPHAVMTAVRDEIAKVVVGQDGVVTGLLIALLVRGHVLLEGVPGTGKTLLAKSLAAALQVDFARVQFTPDLMPSDITGQLVYAGGDRADIADAFEFRPGPVFTNLLLADEINRTPAKTQAALLEAMEERQVSVEGEAWELPDPFLVIATQNPVEHEGTYPLPEAQLDRFHLKLLVPYPSGAQESEILARHDAGMNAHDVHASGIGPVASVADLEAARDAVAAVTVEPVVRDYVVQLAQATRSSPATVLGVSPRGSTMLLRAAKAWAWLSQRDFVTPDDVKAMVLSTWRHRVLIHGEAELEGASADAVLTQVVATVPVPR